MFNMNDLEKQILDEIMKDGTIGRTTIAEKFGISETSARKIVKKCKNIIRENGDGKNLDDVYEDLLNYNANLEKQKQKLRDQQRIERKIRNRIRVENALVDYTNELINIFDKREAKYTIPKLKEEESDIVGIFQISDTHFNELIDISGNKYDFKIAAKRLQKFVQEARVQFQNKNISNVVVAMTGDLLNSDRRIDELLNMSTNRARASALSAILLEQVIVDLAQDFNVTITYVTGNESRVGEFMGSSDITISDNYDVTIFEMLKMMLKNTSVNFIDGDVGEKVIKINNHHILMMHGQQLRGDLDKRTQQIKGKYSDKGIKIDYIIFGHIHSCYIADFYARSSSLCGANSYSDYSLQLTSRASQNIHFVSNDGINSMKIDLQYYDNYDGYDIDDELEEYNAKSSKKGKEEKYVIVNVL